MSLARAVFAFAAGAALNSAPAISAQEPHAHPHDTGQLGRVTFPVSCTPEAAKRFEHAMAVLHSFWWEEGDRAFSAVLQADSTCAMAYWGLAVNAWGNPFAGGPVGVNLTRASEAAARAAAMPARTPREKGFIAASTALYRDAANTTNAARLQAYADTMARLYRDQPKDDEVAIYHALALIATAPRTDTTFAQQRRAAAILNPLFARHPDHPGLAHYIIHATDSPQLASLGLDAARRYARIAPAAPHAQHMPSHIFVRLGLWDEAVASNWASYRAGSDYAKAVGAPEVPPEALHALDYAVYGYLQRGEDSAADSAIRVARNLRVRRTEGSLVREYNGTAMLARIPLEKGDWSSAAALALPEKGMGVAPALTRFARAVGASRSGHPDAARAELVALDSIAGELAGRKETYWERVVKIKRDAADAWRLFASGDTARGLALARAAADTEEVTDKHPVTPGELLPARELEADMLLAAGRPAEARKAYLASLRREPGRARSVFGAARAAQLADDTEAAQAGYRAYLELMRNGDGARAELAMAKSALR